MALPLEDYGVLGNMRSAAVVGVDGSIDWLCLPRFDSGACFSAILGTPADGRWLLAPAGEVTGRRHAYRGDTMVLETTFDTSEGQVRVVDAMPIPRERDDRAAGVVRLVEGVHGRVRMRSDLVPRFDYGSVHPWIHRLDGRTVAAGGPDAVVVTGPVEHEPDHEDRLVATFTVGAGDRVAFHLAWFPAADPCPQPLEAAAEIDRAQRFWQEWANRCTYTRRLPGGRPA